MFGSSVLLLVLFLTAPPDGEMPRVGEAGDAIVATSRDGPIRAGEFRAWLLSRDIDESAYDRRELLGRFAAERYLEREARELGVHATARYRFGIRLARETALRYAYGRRVTETVSASPSEVAAFLEAHPERWRRPRKLRLQNLFRRVPPEATVEQRDAVKAEVEAIRERLLAGADFVETALAESDSQTRYRGATIGNVGPGELPPDLEAVVFSLEPGEISPVTETVDGFTLFRVDSIVPAHEPTAQEMRQRAQEHLSNQQRQEAWQAERERLTTGPEIEIDLEAAHDPATADTAPVLRYPEGELTRAEVRLLAAERGFDRPLAEQPPARLRALLEDYLLVVRAAQAARDAGLADDPSVRQAVERRSRELLAGEALRRRVAARFEPLTEGEIEAYYAAHRDSFHRLERYELRAIRSTFTARDARAAMDRMVGLTRDLRSAALGFEEASRAVSDLPVSQEGGYLGWLTSERVAGIGPRLLRALELHPPGAIVGPVQQDDGLWILQAIDYEPARPETFAEARDEAERRLGQARVAALQAEVEEELVVALEVEPLAPTHSPFEP